MICTHNCQGSHLSDIVERVYFVDVRKDLFGCGLFAAVEIEGAAVIISYPGTGNGLRLLLPEGVGVTEVAQDLP